MFFGDGLQCLQVYQAGVRNLDLTFIFKNVAWPVIAGLSLTIALPYVAFMGIVPLTGIYDYIHTMKQHGGTWTYVYSLFSILGFKILRMHKFIAEATYLL